MKSLVFILAFVFATPTFAYDYCKLQNLPETDTGIFTGSFFLTENEDKTFTMRVNGTYTEDDEGTNPLEGADVCSDPQELTGDTLAAEIKNDEALQFLETQIGEKAIKLKIYIGAGFKEDGAGLALYSLIGKSGKTASMTYIGWLPALCL